MKQETARKQFGSAPRMHAMGDDLGTLRGHPYITSTHFCTFSDPPTQYVSMNIVLNVSHFLSPTCSLFGDVIYEWAKIWGPLGLPKRVPNQFAYGIYGQNYCWSFTTCSTVQQNCRDGRYEKQSNLAYSGMDDKFCLLQVYETIR